MKKLLIVVAIAVIAVVAIAAYFFCSGESIASEWMDKTVSIEQIIKEPQRYADQQIMIKGIVSKPVGFFNHCWFKVSDETGTISVYGKHYMAPADGERVKLKGKVKLHWRVGNYHILFFEIQSH